MKALSATLLATTLLFAATGCSKKEPAPAASSAATSSAPSAGSAATPATSGPRVITVSGNDTMKFDVTRVEAKPGEELKFVLKNSGSMPKQTMGHNLVLLKSSTDVTAYLAAAVAASKSDYIPEALNDQVLGKTKLLGARETDEFTVKAPAEAGEYPYVCTFPAHAQLGMKGVLVVK